MGKIMKRINSIFLIFVLILSTPIQIFAKDNNIDPSVNSDKLYNFIKSDNDDYILNSRNYIYMRIVEEFREDPWCLYFLEFSDLLVHTGAEPDEEKYIETLINIIATSDIENAGNISTQNKMDNLKSYKDYALDLADIVVKSASILSEFPGANDLEKSISFAMDGINLLSNNIDNWLTAFSNLETIIQNYIEYDKFLELIENKADGELKKAASSLRHGMSTATKKTIESFSNISEENIGNYTEFFFSNFYFEPLKTLPEYSNDENIKFFVDGGEQIFNKINMLKDSFDLGKKIGLLVGDFVIGGSDLITRLREMMALYDISTILQDELRDYTNQFLSSDFSNNNEAIIQKYIMYFEYLAACRVRGEYCVYSITINDAELFSYLYNVMFPDMANDITELYNITALHIQNILDYIKQIEIMDSIDAKGIENQLDGHWLSHHESFAEYADLRIQEDNNYVKLGVRSITVEGTYHVRDDGALMVTDLTGEIYNNAEASYSPYEEDGYLEIFYHQETDTLTCKFYFTSDELITEYTLFREYD